MKDHLCHAIFQFWIKKHTRVSNLNDLTIVEYIELSPVNQPMYDRGFRATNKLIQRLHNPGLRVSIEVHHPEPVIRSSTENLNKVTT